MTAANDLAVRKHGPIALIDGDLPIIAIAPLDDVNTETISNLQEVTA